MPKLPDDDIQRLPDADRIRNRIRERRDAESGSTDSAEQPTTDLKWNTITDRSVRTDSTPDGVVDHKADDIAVQPDRPEPDPNDLDSSKIGGPDSSKIGGPDSSKIAEVKTADFADSMKLDRTIAGYTEASSTGKRGEFSDADEPASAMKLGEPDDITQPVGHRGDEGNVATGGVKFDVPTDQPGDGESFTSISGIDVVADRESGDTDDGIIPTGETAQYEQALTDPVGDAIAPLDGDDQLVDLAADPASDFAALDDGLDDSLEA